MRICPKCCYLDPFCWHNPISKGMEVEYARFDDLKEYQPEIAEALEKAPIDKRGRREWNDGKHYAYMLYPSGYVRRRYFEIWKVHAWKSIPMEKHRPREPNLSIKEFCERE